jgi:RNA polymerase-binding transcription factor DksA
MKTHAKLKKELEAKLAELTARVEAVENRLAQPTDPDWEESAATIKDDEILQKIDAATQAELHEVKLALNKLENGTYGKCATCGHEIAAARLEALPFATECIGCASKH